MTPIGQPCACEPMAWLYFVFVRSVFVFVELTLVMGADGEYWKLGKLGPDLDSEQLLRAKEKKDAIKEMDRIVRDKNRRAAAVAAAASAAALSKIDANKQPKAAAASARDRALAFAKQVPKPEVKRSTSAGSGPYGGGPGNGVGGKGAAAAAARRRGSAHDEYFYGGGAQLSEVGGCIQVASSCGP
jgi:hypothetical protein